MISYTTISHGMSETSYLYLLHVEMSIILDNVSCMLHLSTIGRLLDHYRMTRSDVLEMIVTYLGVGPMNALKEIKVTRVANARFRFMESQYTHHLSATEQADGDNDQVMHHIACTFSLYHMYLVGTPIFLGKSSYHIYVVYLIYFIDLEKTHEYNLGAVCLVHLYFKLVEGCLWKTIHMTTRCTPLAEIYLHPLLFMYHFYITCGTPLLIINLYHF